MSATWSAEAPQTDTSCPYPVNRSALAVPQPPSPMIAIFIVRQMAKPVDVASGRHAFALREVKS